MSLLASLRLVLAPPHRAARPFLAAGAAVMVLGSAAPPLRWFWPLIPLGATFCLFCLYFFRNPERVTPPRRVVVAGADGIITAIDLVPPPPELGIGHAMRFRVATFLSVLNVHVNRVPADGEVTAIAYTKGKFLNASLDKASEHNERNAIAITMPDGRELAVVQIAGLIARRIMCDIRPGDQVRAGDRFGIIRFGSRTDIYLPPGVSPLVAVGQTMVGGETVIAELDR